MRKIAAIMVMVALLAGCTTFSRENCEDSVTTLTSLVALIGKDTTKPATAEKIAQYAALFNDARKFGCDLTGLPTEEDLRGDGR